MRIIVVGAGKVGRTVTDHLAKEGHSITVIDQNANVVARSINTYDVQSVYGNGINIDVLTEAGVEKCDLLIALTSTDEINILCCTIAKKLGAKQTIARVRNPDYAKQLYQMREEFEISMFVNPELDAAMEISRMLRFPSAISIDSFANGKVDLVQFRIDEGSPLVGKNLPAVRNKYQVKFLICAVQRGEKVFIPKGDFIFRANDEVYVSATNKEITNFFKKLNIYKKQVKKVIVVGGGRITYYLAHELSDSGFDLKLIDKNFKRVQELANEFTNMLVLEGDGTDQQFLNENGLSSTDAFISLTGLDEENIIMSMFAKTQGVEKIITKVNHASYETILDIAGLESVITPHEITTNHIIRYVRGMESKSEMSAEFRTLYRLVNNTVEALEFYIPCETKYTFTPLKDLRPKEGILIACIIRGNDVIIPDGMSEIKPQDIVIVITTEKIKDMMDIFTYRG